MARRSAFASTAAAIAWALFVVILATALFRWPIVAGNAADDTVTATIGEAVGRLDGDATGTDPGRRRGVTGPRGDPLPRVGRGDPGQPGQCGGQEVRPRPLQVPGAHLA